ncbi:uncharacterized protein LOC113457229 [Microtus ochrogaster]|uniref:Uncharacterized protein LOC113457229 n=1 Tax=Microtus ochrogaster TaxID=79684 RepID=A0ABM1UD41_MICOH|nr:uncharacterized protein LOC113457229 [Microtus ochrogaster]
MAKQEFQGKKNAVEEDGVRGRASQAWKKHRKFIDERPQPRPHTRRPLGPAPGLLRPPPSLLAQPRAPKRKAARVRLSLPQSVLPTTPLLTTGLRLSTRTPDFDARARPRRQTQKPLRAKRGRGGSVRETRGRKAKGRPGSNVERTSGYATCLLILLMEQMPEVSRITDNQMLLHPYLQTKRGPADSQLSCPHIIPCLQEVARLEPTSI